MNVLLQFHFLRPWGLVLIPAVLLWWWLSQKSRDPLAGWRRLVDAKLLAGLVVGESSRRRLSESLQLAAWILAAVAVSGPTWRPEPSPFADDPVPVMLVLRAGDSMSSEDMLPSRMARAQLKVTDFTEQRDGQPMGLIAYSGSAHLVLPPTRDTAIVAEMAGEISPEIMPREGDELLDALELAARAMDQRTGSIVVVADTIQPAEKLRNFRSEYGCPVVVLAIARPETPESDRIQEATRLLGASLQMLSPDDTDIRSLVRLTARPPLAVSDAGEGVRWAEMGWWLVPPLTALTLLRFRRVRRTNGSDS